MTGCQNKKKARRSSKKSGYYKNQHLVTSRNKLRRKLKREANRKKWRDKADAVLRHAIATTRAVMGAVQPEK